MSLLDATNPYLGLLSPQEQGQVNSNYLLNLGMGLAAASGPSRMPVSLLSAFGQSGLNANDLSQRQVPGLFNAKLLKNQVDIANLQFPAKKAAFEELQRMGTPGYQSGSHQSGTPNPQNSVNAPGNVPYYLSNQQNDQAFVNGLSPQTAPQTQSQGSVPGVPYFDPQTMFKTGLLFNQAGMPGGDKLISDALAHDPNLAAATTRATRAAALPYDAITSVLHGAGRNVVVSPGQTATSGIALMPPQFQNFLFGSVGGAGGTPQPGSTGSPASIPKFEGMSPFQAETQKARASDLEKQYGTWQDQADKAKQDNLLMDRMRSEMQNWEPNKYASNWASVKETLNAIDPSHKVFSEQLGDFQAFSKNAVVLSAGAARNMGAREPGSVIAMFQKAYPNVNLTRNALDAMMTQFQGTNDYKTSQQSAADSWRENHNGTLAGFQSQWNKAVDPMYFVVRRMPEDVRTKYLENLSPDARAKFGKGYSNALQQGFLPAQ